MLKLSKNSQFTILFLFCYKIIPSFCPKLFPKLHFSSLPLFCAKMQTLSKSEINILKSIILRVKQLPRKRYQIYNTKTRTKINLNLTFGVKITQKITIHNFSFHSFVTNSSLHFVSNCPPNYTSFLSPCYSNHE